MSLVHLLLALCALHFVFDTTDSVNIDQSQMQSSDNQRQYETPSDKMATTNKAGHAVKVVSRVKRRAMGYELMSWVTLYKADGKYSRRIFPNPVEWKLEIAGNFLAAHKYFDVDRRYTFSTTKFEDPKFFKHFPVPRLKRLHPIVQRECDKGAFECLTEISNMANISGSLQDFYYKKNRLPNFYPFRSALELFQYRTTASYYLCWYTDHSNPLMAFKTNTNCLANLPKVAESDGKRIFDFRSVMMKLISEKGVVTPFTCSFLWFCPDPCYGKSTSGNVPFMTKAVNDKLNPCSRLRDKTCFWVNGRNNNFDYLIRNRINYTCNCGNERAGFVWSPKYSICIDQDECYDGVVKCPPDKICSNTVGSHTCRCRRGFKENTATKKCERLALFRATSHKGLPEKQRKEKPTEESAIWSTIDGLFGLNSSAKLHLNSVVYAVLCILCLIVFN